MARKTVYLDDVTQKEIADGEGGPVQFSLNGEWWEFDIGNDTLAKMTKALQPYIDAAISIDAPRPEPIRRGRPAVKVTKVQGKGPDYLDAVRRWGRANGYTIADRGRIKAEIVDAYEAANKS